MPDATSLSPELARVAQEALIKGAKATNTEAQELADSLSTNLSAEQVLQKAASIPDFETGRSVVDANTSRKDKDGKTTRSTEEDKLKKSGEDAIKYGKELYLKGYEKMTADGKRYVREKVAANFLTHPSLRDMFKDLPGGTSTANYWSENMARRYLKDPRYKDSLAKFVSGQMGTEKILEDAVSTLEVELTLIKEENTKLEKEKTTVKTEISNHGKELKKYDTSVTKPGEYAKQATKLDGEIDAANQKIADYDMDLSDLKDTRENIRAQMQSAKTPTERDALGKQLKNAQRDIRDAQVAKTKEQSNLAVKTAQREAFETNKKQTEDKLEERKKYLKEKIEDIIAKNDKSMVEKNPKLASLQAERILNMKKYINELEGVFGSAANELLEAEMAKAAGHLQTTTNEKSTKATNERDKKILEKSATLFFRNNKLDKGNIQSYKDVLMTEATEIKLKDEKGKEHKLLLNGAEKALNKLMIDSGISEADRYKNFQDKTFVDTQSKDIAKSIIAHKFMVGGFSKNEMRFIVEGTTWGRGLVAEALQQKDNINKELQEAFGANGKLFRSGEWLKGSGKWILAAIAILIALGIFKYLH
jgi:hypothetical protein